MLSVTADELVIIKKILAKYIPDREVWAFGSRVAAKNKKYSDLDIAILGEDPVSLEQMTLLREAFENSNLNFRVDLVDWNSISPAFRKIIEKEYVRL